MTSAVEVGRPTQRPSVTSGGIDRLDKTVDLIVPMFEDDPIYTFFLCSKPEVTRKRDLHLLLYPMMKSCALNDSHLIEAGDWAACAILLPPGRKADGIMTLLRVAILPTMELGLSVVFRLLSDYMGAVESSKRKGMSPAEIKSHWYVCIMGTNLDRRRQGFAGAMIKHMQELATADGWPIWLEATTAMSRQLYLKHGFEDVEPLVLGKGKVGSNGKIQKDGKGVTIWAMVWRPDKIAAKGGI